MSQFIAYLKQRPLLLSVIGWALLPTLYLIVGLLAAANMDVALAFSIATPLGLIAIVCWCLAIFYGIKHVIGNQYRIVALLAIVTAALPLAFLLFGFWAAANGA
jgi:hypothetical protein